MPGFENAVAGAVKSTTQVIIPAVSWAARVALAFNWYFSIIRVAAKTVGLLVAVFLCRRGLPWLSQLSGGTLATTFTL